MAVASPEERRVSARGYNAAPLTDLMVDISALYLGSLPLHSTATPRGVTGYIADPRPLRSRRLPSSPRLRRDLPSSGLRHGKHDGVPGDV